tara:strand:- start:2273 stop:3004 length:732 start_codon:yes stop_codon:yes gene_type:complete
LPKSFQYKIGTSKLLKGVRNVFFRTNDNIQIIEGLIKWEKINFYFSASFHTFYKAKTRGIENRIIRTALTTLDVADTAIDVGSNYGFIAIIMGKYLSPKGKVISFEIDPSICKILNKNIKKNHLSNNIHLIEKGAGSNLTSNKTTIDIIVDEKQLKKIKFLKIDIDGDDLDVLIGAYKTLNQFHPVVVIEMTKNQKKIYDFLSNCGYKYFMNQSNETVHIDNNNWPLNLIASTQKILIPKKIF